MARLFLLSRAGARRRMHIIAGKALAGILSPALAGLFWRTAGDERIATIANQVRALRLPQRFANLEIVFRLEELHQRSLEFPIAKLAGNIDRLFREWVDPRVI